MTSPNLSLMRCTHCGKIHEDDQCEGPVLKTEYEYIKFELVEKKPATNVWWCVNKKSDSWIGTVRWYGPWRQYCFFPEMNTVFSVGCMKDVANFVEAAMAARKS